MKRLFAALAGSLAALVGWGATPAHTTLSHPEWSRNAVIYEVNVRQYTPEGTFRAFSRHLPRLKELGADILWLMPIHPISEVNRKGELGSYYAVADYKKVNPEFGSMEDFKALVDSAHAAGIKVIIDWVPNHTGCDNPWVTQHPEYYKLDKDGKMYGPYDWTDVYQLDYSQRATRSAMLDAMTFWLTETGIDGFRCDVAGMVPVDFWNEARAAFDTAAGRPVFMLAEATEPELAEHAFDMVYNWPMKDLFSHIAASAGRYSFGSGKPNFPAKNAADIDSLVASQAATYPADSYMMNMTSNHDLNSWEGTEFERLGNLQEAFAVLTYTLPGMPLIYTGQEAAFDRAFEFFEKDTPADWNARPEVAAFYKKLNTLKHNYKDLRAGDGAKVERIATASPDVIAFRRGDVMVVANLGAKEERLFKKAPKVKGFADYFTGAPAVLPKTLAPGAYLVFVK